MPFDARAAKLLPAGQHIIVDEHPGLRLVVGKASRSWIYRYKDDAGRMRQTKLGGWPAMSLVAAAAEWEKLRAMKSQGVDPAVSKKVQRQARAPAPRQVGYTVQALWDDYMEGHIKKRRKPKGAREVARLFEKHCQKIAPKQAASITRADAFDTLKAMEETPVLASQLKQELGGAWDYALDGGRLEDTVPNWWRQIMRGRLRSKGKKIAGERIGVGKRVLSDAEVAALVPWLPNFSKTVCDVLTVYLWTGCRGAEIVSMEAGEISEEPGGLWWTIPKHKTKNERHEAATDLRVPLVGQAELVVRRRLKLHAGYLFPSRSKSGFIEQKAIQTAVWFQQPYSGVRPEDNRPRLTVTHWAPHDLRRTVRTKLAALGCPVPVAESVIGHMQPGVYDRHHYDDERRHWLTLLDAHWVKITAPAASAG